MKPAFVDFHAHLDLYPDLSAAIQTCESQLTATLAVTTTPKAFPRNVQLAGKSRFVRVALGLHPQLVAERSSEIDLFEELLPQTRYVGEVGLDAGPRYYKSFDLQKSIFERVLRASASAGGKVLSIHSVRAAKPVLDMLDEYFPRDRGTAVLHWFTGSLTEVRRAVALGCFFSVNERMLASPNGQKILCEIPFDRLLTETDGPFIERSGVPIAPGDVTGAVQAVSKFSGFDEAHVKKQVLSNLASLLQLNN